MARCTATTVYKDDPETSHPYLYKESTREGFIAVCKQFGHSIKAEDATTVLTCDSAFGSFIDWKATCPECLDSIELSWWDDECEPFTISTSDLEFNKELQLSGEAIVYPSSSYPSQLYCHKLRPLK